MRWWTWTLVVVAALVVVGTVVVLLLPKNPNVGDRSKLAVTFSAAGQHTLDTVTVTRAELAAATCDGAPHCWVAVDGVVYDLTGLDGWKAGKHHGVKAGTDATKQFVSSGHPKGKIEGLPVVGRLGG